MLYSIKHCQIDFHYLEYELNLHHMLVGIPNMKG